MVACKFTYGFVKTRKEIDVDKYFDLGSHREITTVSEEAQRWFDRGLPGSTDLIAASNYLFQQSH